MTQAIPLSSGYLAVVDDADYGRLSVYKWYLAGTPAKRYASRHELRDGKKRTVYMHRLILNAPAGIEVDHIDGDGLNNTRTNLRLVTRVQQMQNRKSAASHSLTGVRGVTWNRAKGKYQVYVKVSGRNYHGGFYDRLTDAEAAAVVARRHYMTHARDPEASLARSDFGLAQNTGRRSGTQVHLFSGSTTLCGNAVQTISGWKVVQAESEHVDLASVNCRQCRRIVNRRPWLIEQLISSRE
jgi:hypothetical protein